MAIAGYLITIDPTRFAKLNRELAAQLPGQAGEPLAPISSRRAFMSIDTLRALQSAIGGPAFDKALFRNGAEWGDQVDDDLAVALFRTREPADLPPRDELGLPPVADPLTGKLLDWHLVEVQAAGAWDLLGGHDKIDWTGVTVGHIDTGFTTHPALGFKKNVPTSPWVDTLRDRNFFSKEVGNLGNTGSPAAMFASWDSAEDTLGGFSGGHGTRTGSVLCGFDTSAAAKASVAAGPSFAGYFGIAPRVPVVPVRVEDSVWVQNELGTGLPDSIDYLVDSAAVDVISFSMGSPRGVLTGTDVPKRLKDSLRNAYTHGVIVVCAAGNHIPDEQVVFPARQPFTLAVGGSAPKGQPWSGSSYGAQVDISAPAYPIRRATTKRGNKYEYGAGDGTSFATPLVAGTAALWLVHHKGALDAAYPERWQRVAAFLAIIKRTAHVPQDWSTATRGAGILNARAVLQEPLPRAADLLRETE